MYLGHVFEHVPTFELASALQLILVNPLFRRPRLWMSMSHTFSKTTLSFCSSPITKVQDYVYSRTLRNAIVREGKPIWPAHASSILVSLGNSDCPLGSDVLDALEAGIVKKKVGFIRIDGNTKAQVPGEYPPQ